MKNIAYLVFLFLIACGNNKQTVDTRHTTSESIIAEAFLKEVVTANAVSKPLQQELTLTGKVIADPDRTISYSPLVSGVVVRSYFTLGDRVSRGQTMLDIRSAELSGLQSELTIAQRNLQSAEALFESGIATEREVIEARATYEKLQADLALYGENKGNGVFSITAPMSGYVIEKNGNTGSTVSADSEPLFSIADLSTVWVVANIYAGNLQSVREGQSVEITSIAYPGEVFSGKIDFISQVFDPEDKTLKARIVMPNPELKLKPEMMAVVKVLNESVVEMTTVPSNAVIFDNNRHFVITGNRDFAIREVVPFNRHNGITYISAGLEPGEEVVIKNQLLIYNELKGK
jgi:cobalt-zinc-cadmium efflux system membrane fusion protein